MHVFKNFLKGGSTHNGEKVSFDWLKNSSTCTPLRVLKPVKRERPTVPPLDTSLCEERNDQRKFDNESSSVWRKPAFPLHLTRTLQCKNQHIHMLVELYSTMRKKPSA